MTLKATKKSLAEVTETFQKQQDMDNVKLKLTNIHQSMTKNCMTQESAEEGEETPIESEDEYDYEQKLQTVRSQYDRQRKDLKSRLPSELEELRIEIADLKKSIEALTKKPETDNESPQ